MSKDHYVPRLLSKRFKFDNGLLWYFDGDKPCKGVDSRNPRSIFQKANLERSRKTKQSDQGFFSKSVETPFDRFLNDNISHLRSGESQINLTDQDREAISKFAFYQVKRSPEIIGKIFEPDAAYNAVSITDEQKQLHEQIRQENSADSESDLMHEARRQVMAAKPPADILREWKKGIGFARVPNGSHFVIGSRPVHQAWTWTVRLPSRSHKFCCLSLPIAHDLVIFLNAPDFDQKVGQIKGKCHIRKFNAAIWSQSKSVAGPDRNKLEKLVKLHQ